MLLGPESTLKVLNLAIGREKRMSVELGGSETVLTALGSGGQTTLGPEGQRALSWSADGTLKVWDLASGCEIASLALEAGVCHAAVGSGGYIVAGDSAGNLYCLELKGSQPITGTHIGASA